MTANEGQQILVAVARLEENMKRLDEKVDGVDGKVDETIKLQRETNGNVTRLKEWRVKAEGQLETIVSSDSKWADRRWTLFAGGLLAVFSALVGAGAALII